MKETIKKSFIGGLVFLSTVIIGGLAYAAVSSSVNSGDTLTANMWNNMNNYSTDEINTGKKWIDGKDIYRKAFDLDIPGGIQSLKFYGFGETLNVDTLINAELIMNKSGTNRFQVDENSYLTEWVGYGTTSDATEWGSDLVIGSAVDGFYFKAKISHSGYVNAKAIVEYTKTN